jgi:phage shock protein A
MLKKLRNWAPVIAAVALVLSGVTPAHAAAIKQGTKCAPVNAKKTVGSIKYTCTTNPAGIPTGLSWTTADCLAAGTAYATAKAQYDDFVATQTSTYTAIKASIDASKHTIDVLNAAIVAANTKQYTVDYDHSVQPAVPIKVVGIDAAIKAITAHIADVTAKRDNAAKQRDLVAATLASKYPATQIAAWAASPISALNNSDVNVTNYGNWIRAYQNYDIAIASSSKDISNLQKIANNFQAKIAKAQSQVDSMTARYNAAVASQPALSKVVKDSATQALSLRKSACKVGL